MTQQFATFYLDGTLWGLDVLHIREVIQGVASSSVPHAPQFVHGLMNLRGQIVTIIDLAARMGHQIDSHEERDTCVILKTDSELETLGSVGQEMERTGSAAVGLLVDRMGDVVDIDSSQLDPSPANTNQQDREYVKGVSQLEADLMLVLRLSPIFEGAN